MKSLENRAARIARSVRADASAYRVIIRTIHREMRAVPFSTSDVVRASGISTSGVKRILTTLQRLGLVHRTKRKVYKDKHYRVAGLLWNTDDVNVLFQQYEYARALRL